MANFSDLIGLLCFCAAGIQYSYGFIAEYNAMMNNCRTDGGYCIHTIPPRPPRRRQQQRRRPMSRTRTRKGSRAGQGKPDPTSLGQQHTRLPASAGGGSPAAAGAPAYTPAVGTGAGAQAQAPTNPMSMFDNLFNFGAGTGTGTGTGAGTGTSANDPFATLFGMSLFRKKRQAAEPMEAAEIPRIARGENMLQFLNTHCRKSEFDIGCRQSGGMCCIPHP